MFLDVLHPFAGHRERSIAQLTVLWTVHDRVRWADLILHCGPDSLHDGWSTARVVIVVVIIGKYRQLRLDGYRFRRTSPVDRIGACVVTVGSAGRARLENQRLERLRWR